MKPSILCILHLPPPIHGAAVIGQYLHDSKSFNDTFDCHFINLTTADSLQDIGKGSFRKLWTYAKLLFNIAKSTKRYRPKLVYITPNTKGIGFYKDFIVIQLVKLSRRKIIVHFHNKGVEERQGKAFDNFLYKRFFNGIKVILLAKSLFQDIKKYVPMEDVYICPNGIASPLDEINISQHHTNTPKLLFLSNLLIAKGVFTLLDALKKLKDCNCHFTCNLIGGETTEINSEKINQEILSRGLNHNVFYKGSKYGKDKEEEFAAANIFVFPTHSDCFPLVLLEAMQHKLPCISTIEGGIPNIIDDGKTGFVVLKKDPDVLANKIKYLLDHPEERRIMGENGYKKYEQQFTLSHFENNIIRCLTKELFNN